MKFEYVGIDKKLIDKFEKNKSFFRKIFRDLDGLIVMVDVNYMDWVMRISPRIFSLRRKYLLQVSHKKKHLEFILNMTDTQFRGWVGHELCRILEYKKLGLWDLIRFYINFFIISNYGKKIDKNIDIEAIRRGLGEELYSALLYRDNRLDLSDGYGARSDKFSYSASEIRNMIKTAKRKVLVIDNGTTLIKSLREVLPSDTVFVPNEALSIIDIKKYELIILSGTTVMPIEGNEGYYADELNLIKDASVPLVGICFGAELINKVFGGKLGVMEKPHFGNSIIIGVKDSIAIKKGEKYKVYGHHQWFISGVAKDLEVVGISDHGPAIIQHKLKPIYGFQFHPEGKIDDSDGIVLLNNILKEYGFLTKSYEK